MGPYYKAPGPLRSAGVPPGAASWSNIFDHLLQENFLVRKCFYDCIMPGMMQ